MGDVVPDYAAVREGYNRVYWRFPHHAAGQEARLYAIALRLDALESVPGTQECRVAWRKYRNGSLDLAGGELGRCRLMTMVKSGVKPLAPYAYSPEALANLRRQAREKTVRVADN